MRYILLFISLFPLTCLGQRQALIDSLNAQSFEMRSRQKDSSFLLGKQAYMLSEKAKYDKGLSMAKLNLGMFYLNRDSLEKASGMLIECEHDFVKSGDKFHLSMSEWYLAKLYFRLGESDKSEAYYRQSAKHFEEIDDKTMQLYVKNGLAVLLILQQRQSAALEIFEELLTLTNDLDIPQGGRHNVYNNISHILIDLGRYKEALTYVHRAIKEAELTDFPISQECRTASIAHHYLGNVDSTNYYINKSLEIGRQQQVPEWMAMAYFRMADFKKAEGDLIAATKFTRLGIELLKDSKSIAPVYHAQYRLAQIYENMDLTDSAIFYTKISYHTAIRGNLKKSIRSRAKKLSDLFEKRGELDSSYKYLTRYVQLTEEAYVDSAQQAFNKAQVRLAVNDKAKEIKYLQTEWKQSITTRNHIIIGIGLVLVIIAMIVINYVQRLHRQRQKSKEREGQLSKEIEEKRNKLSEYALQIVLRNKGLEDINNILGSAQQLSKADIQKVLRTIKTNQTSEEEWKQFSQYFGDVHRNFFQKLTKEHPTLSTGDLRHAILVKMNLTLKESSTIMGISPNSIKMARYRLKKKIGILAGESLKQALEEY